MHLVFPSIHNSPAPIGCRNLLRVVYIVLLVSGCRVPGSAPHSAVGASGLLNSADKALQFETEDWLSQQSAVEKISASVAADPQNLSNHNFLLQPVSANVHSVKVSQLLDSIAAALDLELNMHGQLDAEVSLFAEHLPLRRALEQLAGQTELYWELSEQQLKVWDGKPFTKSYPVDYLNIDRRTQSRVGLATQVGTINATQNTQGSGVSNSSQTQLENVTEHLFWTSITNDLNSILGAPSANLPYAINRDVGLLTLHASKDVHTAVVGYLEKLNESAQRQVLIEATVIEVTLSDTFSAGVDWQLLANSLSGVSAAQVLSGVAQVTSETIDRITAPNALFSVVQQNKHGNLNATVNLLQEFGDVRIVSKPRIIALNNQPSVLKVVNNRVYFTVNVERQRSETKDEIITESQIHTVPVGLVMHVTPHISESGKVMLNVRPTLSRILGFVDDPNPELAAANVKNSVPEIQVREMESMLTVQSGQLAIIGGLMQNTTEDDQRKLPGISSLPVIGKLFEQKNSRKRQTELLVVLRPTVLVDQQSLPSLPPN